MVAGGGSRSAAALLFLDWQHEETAAVSFESPSMRPFSSVLYVWASGRHRGYNLELGVTSTYWTLSFLN